MNPEELYKTSDTIGEEIPEGNWNWAPEEPEDEIVEELATDMGEFYDEAAQKELCGEPVNETVDVATSMKELESLVNFVNVESAKSELNSSARELEAKQNQLASFISGGEENRDFLTERLASMTLDECEAHLKSDENVQKFFINEETGDEIVIDIDFESKEKEIDFKRGLLIYLKTSQEAIDNIDEEYRKLDEANKELDMNIKEVCKELSDNTLAFIRHLKEKANALGDTKEKETMLETVKYIESGYTMEVFKEVIIKHPSVGEKCAKELTRVGDVAKIGERYNKHLVRGNIKASLIPFTSDINTNVLSFEEQVLIEGDQYTVPDLFVYSLIRYFAMADWSDSNVRKAHASIILVIKRLLANDFDEAVKADIIANIVEYLKMFKV